MKVLKDGIEITDFDAEVLISKGYQTYNQYGCHCSW